MKKLAYLSMLKVRSSLLASRILLLTATLFVFAVVCPAASAATHADAGATSPDPATPPLYPANRAPLVPSPLMKLPIGSITPHGWLRGQLDLEAAGLTGRLPEISKWCKFEGNSWSDPKGAGHSGWEELPYWLKGYGDLGYVLKDEAIIKETRKWIDAVLASQQPDGWFGPRGLQTSLDGKPDLWPHMLMCNVLQSFYEYSGDERVLPFLTRYFQWLNKQPTGTFSAGYWPKLRWGDSIETAYWLYNRTGDAFLLDVARKIHENMARWDSGVINWHNVNIAQGFREPGVYYMQAKDEKFLSEAEKNYRTVMDMYGQFPGGGFAGDENCRRGYTDPRQGFETCGMVEFMHSFEMLTKISGNPIWSDRCEEIAFNSLPAALTPDEKALHYLTCANQVQLDKNNKSPGVENSGTMFSYSPFEVYRCCQHNVSHGWPYYAEEMWLATADHGLCASLYGASEVTAKVGDGAMAKIVETTDYPFSDTIQLHMELPKSVAFPLQLRIPNWCKDAQAKINGAPATEKAAPGSYLVLKRSWQNGDTVTLQLPMQVSVRRWAKNGQSASVDYGPLTFSLKIGEDWRRYGGTDAWPEQEVYAKTPWNYGLEFNDADPVRSLELVKSPGPVAAQPFTQDTAPIQIRAHARKIPAWTQDKLGLVGKLQASPIHSEEPVETVTLIPMGAARLRITAFPVIGRGPAARDWMAAKPSPVSASHCYAGDTVEAMIEGPEPKNSNDHDIPRFTWWDHRGSTEWVQYDFKPARQVGSIQVYWFDDTGNGQCRVPASWRILYQSGTEWLPVEGVSQYAVQKDAYNRVTFKPISTTALRIEAKLQPNFSGGILRWKIGE